jgi:Fur family zinc uptake transcriptional regulator
VENGFVHRIERLNAFVACHHPDGCEAPAFLICRGCRMVAESQSRPRAGALGRDARAMGFEIEEAVIEVQGMCPACRSDGAA